MILFFILMLIVLLLGGIGVALLSIGGSAFIVLFSDVIVCVFLIIWIMKKLIKRRR